MVFWVYLLQSLRISVKRKVIPSHKGKFSGDSLLPLVTYDTKL